MLPVRPSLPLFTCLRRPLITALLVAGVPSLARAGDWYVDDDGNCGSADGSAGNPFCEIQEAVLAASAGDTIHVAAGEYGQAVVVDRDLTLIGDEGRDVTFLRVATLERSVTVLAGVSADLEGLTISGSAGADGGLRVEAAATVGLSRCTVAEHHQGLFTYGTGAGIHNSGTLELVECVVLDNWTVSVWADYPTGPGGGIYNDGTLTLVDCWVHKNGCGDSGGGLHNAGVATLVRSTVTKNTAYDPCAFVSCGISGGGIYSSGTLTLGGCVVAGNRASLGAGLSITGTARLSSCTFAWNTGQAWDSAEGILVRGGALTLDHTIVAWSQGPDVCGPVTSNGHNLLYDTSCATITGPATGDLYGVDPKFDEHGWDTSLYPDSPCVDAGDPAYQPTGHDIDGKPRLLDGDLDGTAIVDMGAYEYSLGGCAVTTYCGVAQNPANAARIDVDTCFSASEIIRVRLWDGPPDQFAYLLVGDAGGTVAQPPGASGDLCVAGGSCLGRYAEDAGTTSGAGTFETDVQNALSNPCDGAVVIAPGATWYFQYWHRLPGGAPSTFSQALRVTFQ